MEFTIKFKGKNWNDSISMEKRSIGILHLDRARKELNLFLPAERLEDRIEHFYACPKMQLPEKLARKTSLYDETTHVEVYTEKAGLNRFAKEVLRTETSKETGEVVKAWYEYEIDKAAILEEWEKLGFPEVWKEKADKE